MITQVLTQYKSGLPDFLLTFIDSIIKVDHSQILRFNFLHYTIDELMRQDIDKPHTFCLLYDPQGLNHIFIENIQNHTSQFPMRASQSFTKTTWNEMTSQDELQLKYFAHPFLAKFLTEVELQKWSKLTIVTIDQIRFKCQANIYINPQQVIIDLLRVIAWNQLYRAKSTNSYVYLTTLLQNIIQIINKKKFHKKFIAIKNKDFEKLLSYQIVFKVSFDTWPYIPDKFREYEEINHYCPTPENRSYYINKRINTEKKPIQCPDNCVCYANLTNGKEEFCKYTLKDGWITQCPNRSNKIECNHKDEQKMKKCRNAQIKKCQRKKCKKNEDDNDENNQIQQCITWGLDFHTRHLVYHSLPEVDFTLSEFTQNKEIKNQFIQHSLLKAINFNGNLGYDLKKACELIIHYDPNKNQQRKTWKFNNQISQQKQQKTLTTDSHPPQQVNYPWQFAYIKKYYQDEFKQKQKVLFTKRDKYYAETLLNNYQYCIEKIDSSAFRIHTKGKGAKCINKQGIKQGSFIVEYFGELYQPWRWYQREDFIKEVMRRKKFKNYIPQFYNIFLETHKDDPEGYDLMVIDPNKKGNFSSRFSHSCSPNCGTVATISDGKYYIGMYSFKDITYGEQLTFDYCCMTESNYQHTHSICLCGTQRCRGYYLDLANSKTFSQLVDKNTCFFQRNSLILQALQKITEDDLKLCREFNIKERILGDAPEWIQKWTKKLLKCVESQIVLYKAQLVEKLTKAYPWQASSTPEARAANIQLYSQTSKNDLYLIRFQNLFTTVDKLKYFLNTIKSKEPPLYYITPQEILKFMVTDKQSILKQIQDVMIQQEKQKEAFLIKKFMETIKLEQQIQLKLFYFRLCCLCVSHMCMKIKQTAKFNSLLLADIIYFYSFTHTYFTAFQYKGHSSQEIKVSLNEITGRANDTKAVQRIQKKYSSQFVWGQLVSWYKQTIVNPQASLSQDRRGTLSYPMIKSTIKSVYPFEKNCRKNFLKAIREKSSSCWPSAPKKGCLLSFKNPFKCYGTVFFENVHNAHKFKDFPHGNLLQNVLNIIDSNFQQKLKIFKMVETVLSGIGQFHQAYNILQHISSKYFSFTQELVIKDNEQGLQNNSKKRMKRDTSDKSNSKY